MKEQRNKENSNNNNNDKEGVKNVITVLVLSVMEVSNSNVFNTKLSFLKVIDEEVWPNSNPGQFARLLAKLSDRIEIR
jgi:hypothetical protein